MNYWHAISPPPFSRDFSAGMPSIEREEEPDEEATGMNSIASFMVQPKKKARANLFVKRGLELVDTF